VTATTGSSSSSIQLFGLLADPGQASSSGGSPGTGGVDSSSNSSSGSSVLAVHPLSAWQQLQQGQGQGGAADHQPWLVMSDPSHLPLTPGWPLRNLLLLAAKRWGVQRVTVLCVRDAPSGRMDPQRSFVVTVQLPALPQGWKEGQGEAPDAVGWEANAQGRLLAR
jgi:ubiquitin-like modifier-activating enzyme ATG7